jgi:hypothetical protein
MQLLLLPLLEVGAGALAAGASSAGALSDVALRQLPVTPTATLGHRQVVTPRRKASQPQQSTGQEEKIKSLFFQKKFSRLGSKPRII